MSNTANTELKSRFCPFVRWRSEQEARELDDLSGQGWQLKSRGPYRQTLEKNEDARYRYAIDFRAGHDEARYLELFREDGWELVDAIGDASNVWLPFFTFFTMTDDSDPVEGCWYFFRKPYDPDRPEGDYEIATDQGSREDMNSRLAAKYTWGLWLFGVIAAWQVIGMVLEYTTSNGYNTTIIGVILYAGLAFFCWLQRRMMLHPRETEALRWLPSVGLVAFFLVRCVTAPTSLVLFIILAVVSSRSALRHRQRIGGRIMPYDMYVLLTVLVVVAIYVGALAYAVIRTDKDYAEAAVPATEDSEVMGLFWELTPYITEDDVMGWIRGYDLGVIRSDDTYSDAYSKGDIKHAREFSIAESSELAWFSKGHDGAYVTLIYAEEGSSYLLSAQMIVNADNGTATCYYYPTEYTENGCDPGFTLTVKTAWYIPKKTYHAETGQEAEEIFFDMIWPALTGSAAGTDGEGVPLEAGA